MRRKFLTLLLLFSVVCISMAISCSDDDESTSILNLSTTKISAKVGERFSVDILLSNTDKVKTIFVEKTIEGKKIENYSKTLDVSNMQFPYTFSEEVVPEDDQGIVVYSFYGLGSNNERIDASDVIVTVNITQLYRLQKYDWVLTSQIIQKEEYAEDHMKDDVNRFNKDWSWQVDWGTTFSASQLETLDSYCAWKMIGTEEKIDSIYMIKYNVFAPLDAIITKYKVIELRDEKLVLESRQDLSFAGMDTDEAVNETFAGISKSSDFTPYRGHNPDNYVVSSCNPGSY